MVLREGADQCAPVRHAARARFGFVHADRQQPQPGLPVQVVARPPACHGGQVVRAGHGHRGGRPRLRRAERRLGPRIVALEPQDAHAEQARVGQLFAQARRHGAEIFADDDAAVAPRLQCDQPQQVAQRIPQVHAVQRPRAVGNHPQPHQPQHMVDAHAAGHGHHGPQHLEESGEALRAHRARAEGGEPPALSLRVEHVRRRAHRQADQQILLPAPRMAAGAVGADREVGDQADRHAGIFGGALRGGQLARRRPLQEAVEIHGVGVVAGEGAHRQVRRRPVGRGPVLPVVQRRMCLAQVGVERLEVRVVEQAAALAGVVGEHVFVPAARGAVSGGGLHPQAAMQRAQHRQPRGGAGGPVDQGIRLQPGAVVRQAGVAHRLPRGLGAEQRGRVDHPCVEEQPARWRVRGVAMRVRTEHGVHGAQCQRVGAVPRQAARQQAGRGVVAQPRRERGPLAVVAQAVELRGAAPQPRIGRAPARLQRIGHRVAARRRDGQRGLDGGAAAGVDAQPVVARRWHWRQPQRGPVVPDARVHRAFGAAAVLEADPVGSSAERGRPRWRGFQQDGVSGHPGDQRRHRVLGRFDQQPAPAVGLVGGAVGGQAQAAQHGAQHVVAHAHRAAGGVFPVDQQAGVQRQPVQRAGGMRGRGGAGRWLIAASQGSMPRAAGRCTRGAARDARRVPRRHHRAIHGAARPDCRPARSAPPPAACPG